MTHPNERGQILIVTVLSVMVLLGLAALSIDASFMYDRRNVLVAAADASAKTVAAEWHRNSGLSPADAYRFAAEQVSAHGLTPGPCGTTTNDIAGICLDFPPADGPFTGVPGYVEARVSQVTPTFFGYVLGFVSATPGGRSVAGLSPSPNCLVVLGSALDALTVNGATLTTHNGCGIVDGGGLALNGGASISAAYLSTTGPDCAGVPNCSPNAPPPLDPLADLPAPSNSCPPGLPPSPIGPGPVMITTADVAMYCGGMVIDNAIVTFDTGTYYIYGPVTAKNASSVKLQDLGAGVTFFIAAGGSFDLSTSNDVTLILRSRNVGPYKGILFYQERGNSTPANILKDTGSLTGALYFPDAPLTMKNEPPDPSDCMLIVANTLTIAGTTDLFRDCAASTGSPVQTITLAE